MLEDSAERESACLSLVNSPSLPPHPAGWLTSAHYGKPYRASERQAGVRCEIRDRELIGSW